MKKFKDKNRQKRRYIRKKTDTSSSSFSLFRVAPIGLLPIFVAGAFLTTSVIATNPIAPTFDINLTFTIPTVTLPNFAQFKESLSSVQMPTVSFAIKPVQIHTPQISITPLISAVTQIALAKQYFSESIVAATFAAAKNLIAFDVLLISSFWQIIYNSITTAMISSTIVYQGIVAVAISLQQIITTLGIIGTMIINAIGAVVQTIFTKIIIGVDNLIQLIQKPFLILGDYYKQLHPYVLILGDHIKQALHEMSGGFDSINVITSEFLGTSTFQSGEKVR